MTESPVNLYALSLAAAGERGDSRCRPRRPFDALQVCADVISTSVAK